MNDSKRLPASVYFNKLKGCKGGFTMVELMVGLVVVAVMAGIGVPTIRSAINHLSGNRAVNELVSELHNARMLAIRHGRPSQVDFNTPVANQYRLTWRDANGNHVKILNFQRFRGGVRFDLAPPGLGGPSPAPVAGIVFSPLGFATTAGDIYITDQDNIKMKVIRIQIAYSGAISEMRWIAASNQWTYD